MPLHLDRPLLSEAAGRFRFASPGEVAAGRAQQGWEGQQEEGRQRQECSDGRTTGWISQDVVMSIGGTFANGEELRFEAPVQPDCPFGSDCTELECALTHPWDPQQTSHNGKASSQTHQQNSQSQQRNRKLKKTTRVCRNGVSCRDSSTCRFLHPSDPGYGDALQQQTQRQFQPGQHNPPSAQSQQGHHHVQSKSPHQPQQQVLQQHHHGPETPPSHPPPLPLQPHLQLRGLPLQPPLAGCARQCASAPQRPMPI